MSAEKLPSTSHRVGAQHKVESYEYIDHYFTVPLTHGLVFEKDEAAALNHPLAEQTIEVFAREVINTSKDATIPVDERPYIVYLQGGPGFEAPRPISDGGWVGELTKRFRVVLLDQRGTGKSTPLSTRAITALGTPEEQAQYLELMRAPSIVADAEVVRSYLLADREDQRWSTVGQSFGGFITLAYLSFAPQSLKDCRVTAGLAPIRAHVDDVYRHTLARMEERSNEYYDWYPEDVEVATKIVKLLKDKEIFLPTGERLTARRFQTLGNYLGGNMRARGLHTLLESALAEGDDTLSSQFLATVSSMVSFYANPLYALLHETIYADGSAGGDSPSSAPSNWSAARMYDEHPQFSLDAEKLLWLGEHIFPWFYDEDPALTPLKEVAEILAAKTDWGRLYDHEQLAQNTVPVAAAQYVPDVYVDYEHASNTASFVGNTRVWTSKTHHHDGLGADGVKILGHLENLLADMR